MSIMAAFIKVILFSYGLYAMLTTMKSAEKTFFKEGLTWFEAQMCCASRLGQLATTDDADSEIVSCHNIPKGSIDLKIWTGNIRRHSEWIEFQGCFLLSGVYVPVNNISECYQKCLHKPHSASEYFAYKKEKCICHIIETIRKTDANRNLCVSAHQNNYAWVYKVLYNASFDGCGNCVASKCRNGSQTNVAERCTSLEIPMCGLPSSTTNWNKSQSNCKYRDSKENHATDMCQPNTDTVKTGMWTNIFRVEISAHVHHGDMIKMTDALSCVIANCRYDNVQIRYYHTNCNEMADAFFCKPVNNSIIMSLRDCKGQTTNFYNITIPHTIGETTISSSDSRYTHQFRNRTQNHYKTQALTTVNTDISKASVSIASTRTVSGSATKFNGNSIFKSTTYSSFLVTGITSAKLPVSRPGITPTMDEHVGAKPEATNIGLICGVTVAGLVLIAVIAIIACKMRNVGPFRKRLYNEDNIEMNNSIDCAIPEYHDTVLNTSSGSVPKDAIRNNTCENTSSGGVRQNKTYSANHEYAVVVKKHPAGPVDPAAQPSEFDLEGGDNQSQRFETEDEYDTLKHTVDKGEEQIENNVYDSSLGVCDGVDPTYNSIKIGPVNNDTTYYHTANIVQTQVNNDTTYDHTF